MERILAKKRLPVIVFHAYMCYSKKMSVGPPNGKRSILHPGRTCIDEEGLRRPEGRREEV
jgi:hypothetical protein